MSSTIRMIGLLLGLLLLVGGADAQTIYKSIGPNGTPVYSDKPPADGKIEKIYEFAELPSSPLPPASEQQASVSHAVSRNASVVRQSSGVLLYATGWCGYCKRARAYLAEKSIAYQEIDVETPNGRVAFAQAGGGKGGVPFLASGNRRMRGFSQAGYDVFFASR